jgi:hypothetical protein
VASEGEQRGHETVMVPVPEDLVDAVDRVIMEQKMRSAASRAAEAFDRDAVEQLMRGLDPSCRALSVLLAGATLAGGNLTLSDVAQRGGWTVHEALGIYHELWTVIWARLGPLLNVYPTPAADTKAATVNWNQMRVGLGTELATMVVAIDRAAPDGA